MMSGFVTDLKHTLRGLAASRTFTAVAVLSLAVGIGANAAIFSVIRVLILDRLPVRDPHELSLVYWHYPGKISISQTNSSGGQDPATGLTLRSNYSYPIYRELRAAAPPGVGIAGFNFLRDAAVQFDDQPAIAAGGLLADGAYFTVLGAPLLLGRGLADRDDQEGAPLVAVLSHAFWMRAFGGDPAIVGRHVRVNSVPAAVIGVTAAGFRGLSKGGFFPQTDITLPLRAADRMAPGWVPKDQSLFATERLFWVRLLARVPDRVDAGAIRRQFPPVIGAHVAPLVTEPATGSATVVPLDGSRGLDQTSADVRRLLYILMGVVGVVLVIACVNLASLTLSRGVARQREMAVRRALGARRAHLVRGMLLEGMALAVAGGALGLLLTWWSRRVLTTILTAGLGTAPLSTQPLEVTVDAPLAAATFGASVLAALLFSLLPAVRLTRGNADTADLRQQVVGARTPKLTLGRVLVALQIAISLPLLVGALLFLRTLGNLGRIDLGFDPEGVAFFKLDPAATGAPAPQHAALYMDLLNRIGALPGVTSTTLIENALLSGWTSNTRVTVDGTPQNLYMNAVGPGFLETMGMRLLAGRVPGVQDGPGAPPVAAINETAARQLFGAASPLGRTFASGSRTIEVVGVVSDSLYDRQRAAVRPTMFDSALQRAGYGGHHIVLRSAVPIETLEPAVRRAVAEVHRDLPVPALKSQVAQMQETTVRERVFAQLLTIFGAFALLLATIGLHGVTSYSVARRTNEIGVRMALGAERGQVLWLIERQVVVLAIVGLAIGVPIAIALAPLVGSLLFGVAPTDAGTVVIAAIVMFVVALAAGLLPARRAATIDPLSALRAE
jgi:predicted permease